MNIDLAASIVFNDEPGLRQFFMDHRFIHEQTAAALSLKYSGSYSTIGLASSLAEDAWVQLMKNQKGKTPQVLADWLLYHSQIHAQTYQVIAGTGTVAPDLSVVDFSKADQFYDWMYVHQQVHDYEQQFLGLT